MGLAMQLGAYALLFRYISAIEQNRRFVLPFYKADPTATPMLLYVIAGCTGLAFIASGLFNFYGKRYHLSLSRDYEMYCSRRMIQALAEANKGRFLRRIKEEQGFSLRSLRKSLIKDTRFCGKIVQIIPNSLLTLGKLTISLFIMIYVQAWLSLLIILVSIPLVLLLRGSSRKVVQLTRKRERLLPDFIAEKKLVLSALLSPEQEQVGDWQKGYEEGPVASFYDTYYGLFRRLLVNDLLITGFIALLVVLIIIVAGNVVLFGSMSWTVFAAYMVALRFFFVSLQGMNGTIKRSSRAYDYIRHYRDTFFILQAMAFAEKEETDNFREEELQDELYQMGLDLDDDDDDDEDEL